MCLSVYMYACPGLPGLGGLAWPCLCVFVCVETAASPRAPWGVEFSRADGLEHTSAANASITLLFGSFSIDSGREKNRIGHP